MKQSRFASWIETVSSTLFGFGLSLLLQWLVLVVWWKLPMTMTGNVGFAVIMTVASLCRGYLVRRVFEFLHIRRPLSPAMQAVVAERYRQIEAEGWDAAHDLRHAPGELAKAGAAYAQRAFKIPDAGPPACWPWDIDWWKPTDARRNLVKAAALIIAELDRLNSLRLSRSARPNVIVMAGLGRRDHA